MATAINRFTWALLCVLVALVFLAYVATSSSIGGGDVVMPLDDAYIHFQYARQMAEGQPYVYNPGDPPTAGATSFLYPVVLGAGYWLGFQGLHLGYWALAFGALMLLAAAWTLYQIVVHLLEQAQFTHFGLLRWLPLVTALLFVLNGAISWHFMSGMETGMVVALTLLTFYTFVTARLRAFVVAASLLALARPEGSIMALIAVGMYGLRMGWQARQIAPLLVIPVLAVGVQPLVNLLLTGSISSTGGVAKSILSMVPFYWDVVIERIFENFTRMWGEFLTGTNGLYTPFALMPLALLGLLRRERWTLLVLLGWFGAVTVAIATLDTAFWHFKRYQMPLIALFYPLAAAGVIVLMQAVFWVRHTQPTHEQRTHPLPGGVAWAVAFLAIIALVLPTVASWLEFQRLYRVNVENIVAQPLPMARWLAENTPEDAVVAVHDVGMMRYLGNRYTLDMVGLTTPDAADAWRNGPGAVAEFLTNHPPDYVAAYTTARGLNYLVDTDIYGTLLAGFPAEYDPADNVALGADFQGIYRYTWEERESATDAIDALDVADLDSERAHAYHWSDEERLTGFITEVYQFNGILDGGRRINGEESFTMQAQPGQDALLTTRLHPVTAGTFEVYIDDQWVDTQWIPSIPGTWFEIQTLIPAEYITDETLNLRILPNTPGGHYMPYYHRLETFDPPATAPPEDPATVTYDRFALTVTHNTPLSFDITAQTDGTASGDYKFFVHLYDDTDSPPVAQAEAYLGDAPPGNWLPGLVTDTLTISDVPSGTYQIALGFYNPYTFERLPPETIQRDYTEDDRRVFIGEITING